jgi:PhoD related phosphatase
VLTDDTYELILDRCRREIEEGEIKHLLVLIGVPIAYPRLVWLENILTSRALTPVKALGRAGILKSGFLNKFDGGVEVLDDLDDHWTATGHKVERNNLVQDLQELAAEKSIRVTILSGDVHLGAVGQFYSNPKLKIPKDRDHRYIPNVISSAIVNTPPPEMLADTLNKRNKVHLLDPYTCEDMIPMFTHDVNGKKRNNKRLLPRRNWCSIREYHPGSTPPPTPPESSTPSDQMSETEDYPPQNRRRFSFSREDASPRNLIRRLSQRGRPPSSYRDDMNITTPMTARRASHDGYFSTPNQPQTAPPTRTSFPMDSNNPAQPQTAPPNRTSFNSTASYNQRASIDALPSAPHPRPGILRRPTNLSEKAAKKGGAPPMATDSHGNLIENLNDHINLEGGLDITINCEVNQGDPAGITTPYRLLIPALTYDGTSDSQKLDGTPATAGGIQRKPTLLKKLGFGRTGNRSVADRQGQGNWGQPSESEDGSFSDGQYSGEDDDEYYDREKKSSGGGLKRWLSGRKGKRQSDRYSPEYDPPQQQQRRGSQVQDEFVGRELRTAPITPTTTKAAYNPPPIEPFPSQARGKAARVMGVDQGPLPVPYAPQQPPLYSPSRQQNTVTTTNPNTTTAVSTGATSLNQSQPLPPPPPQQAQTQSSGNPNSRYYADYELGRPAGQGEVARGYSGVEAYRENRKSGLRRWF